MIIQKKLSPELMAIGVEGPDNNVSCASVIRTGDIWVCPCCNKKYELQHITPKNGKPRHRIVKLWLGYFTEEELKEIKAAEVKLVKRTVVSP